MPLADNLVPVTHRGQELGDEDLTVLDTTDYLLWSVGIPTRESVLVKPGAERKTTCQQGGSRGGADGGAGVELGEQDTFPGHPAGGSEHIPDLLWSRRIIRNNHKLLVVFLCLSMLGVSLAGWPITPRSPQPRSSRLMMMKFGFWFDLELELELELEHGRN